MKIRLELSTKMLALVLTLLVGASVAIWVQAWSLMGMQESDGAGKDLESKTEPDHTGVTLEPSAVASEPDPAAVSYLEQYPGFRFVDWELDEQTFAAEELAREYFTTLCMEEQGWQYFPTPTVRFGSNVKTIATEPQGSNEDYVAALSSGKRTAYYLTLYGVADPNNPVTGYSSEHGCMKESLGKVPGVFALAGELRDSLEQLEVQARAEAEGTEDYQSAYRAAIIAAQDEFATVHRAELEEFQKAHEKDLELVDALIHHWNERG